jgi:hypothetical protein
MAAPAPAAAANGSQPEEPFYFPLLPTLNRNTVAEQARNYGNAQYDQLSDEAKQAAKYLMSRTNPLQLQLQRIEGEDVSVLVLVGKLYNPGEQSALPGFIQDVLRLPHLPTVIPIGSVGEMICALASVIARPDRVKAVVYAGHARGSGARFEMCPDGLVSGSFRHDVLPMATFAALAIPSAWRSTMKSSFSVTRSIAWASDSYLRRRIISAKHFMSVCWLRCTPAWRIDSARIPFDRRSLRTS